jgi:hypothetical protein
MSRGGGTGGCGIKTASILRVRCSSTRPGDPHPGAALHFRALAPKARRGPAVLRARRPAKGVLLSLEDFWREDVVLGQPLPGSSGCVALP